jgi:signal peptide peptidase SppA
MHYPHLAARLYGTPLLLHRAKLEVILSVLQQRKENAGPTAEPHLLPHPCASVINPVSSRTGIAILPVHGTLVKRALGLSAASGLTSYADIGAMLSTAVRDPAVRGILLDIDSPGGETGGVFELAAAVRAATAIKPVWAVANDAAFSAAYAIAAAATRVLLTRTGGVGSIGVIALHVDQSVADANEGLRYTAITAGSRKNDYSPHEPLSTQAHAQLQAEVNRLYELFVAHVATVRGLSAEAVRATNAGLYFGPDALSAGLADALGSLEEASAEFTPFLTPPLRPRASAHAPLLPPIPQENPMPHAHHDTPPAPTLDPHNAPDTLSFTEAAAPIAQARQDVRREMQAIAELCLIAGAPTLAAEFIASGKTQADVRAHLLTMKATQQSPEIRSTLDPDKAMETTSPTSPHHPLIAAVKKLTAQE